jgi:hypothetical protein
MQWVASTLHTTSEHDVSIITTADAHTSAASIRMNWRPPADLNVPVRLAAQMKSGFSACAITFRTSFPAYRWLGGEASQSAHVHCCLQTVCPMCVRNFRPHVEGTNFFWVQDCSPSDRHSVTFQGNSIAACRILWNFRTVNLSYLLPHKPCQITHVFGRNT